MLLPAFHFWEQAGPGGGRGMRSLRGISGNSLSALINLSHAREGGAVSMLDCSSLSSAQLLTPRAPLEQHGDTEWKITSCKAAFPSDLWGISQGIHPSSASQQVSGVSWLQERSWWYIPLWCCPSELINLPQGIFHLLWSRELLRSGPSCHLPPSTAP